MPHSTPASYFLITWFRREQTFSYSPFLPVPYFRVDEVMKKQGEVKVLHVFYNSALA